jgi:hypothetical protein
MGLKKILSKTALLVVTMVSFSAYAQGSQIVGPYVGVDWEAYQQYLSTLPSWNPPLPNPDDPPLPSAHCWDNGETPGNENCPNQIDHVNYLSMPARNQNPCGLCWLYSMIHTLELQYAIELDQPYLELSIQHAISCIAVECVSISECFGEHISIVVMTAAGTEGFAGFLPEFGLVLEDVYPTAPNISNGDFSGSCPNCNDFQNDASIDYYRATGKAYVGELGQPTDRRTMMMALLQGPVVAGFRTSGGWFIDCQNPELDRSGHGISIVGYKDNGQTLVVKNSWGEDYLREMDWDEWEPCGLTTSAYRFTELADPEPFVGEGFCFEDRDEDLIPNGTDNCRTVPNPEQTDTDLDGLGDACDISPHVPYTGPALDSDDDCIGNVEDNCVYKPNPEQYDRDGDGDGDACDDDDDGDGIADGNDRESLNEAIAIDCDSDGIVDAFNDGYSQNDCMMICEELADDYGWTDERELSCKKNCILDNCIDLADPLCVLGTPSCGSRLCQTKYGNPDQNDLDGDAIGDKCESAPTSGSLEFGPHVSGRGFSGLPVSGSMWGSGYQYGVAFRARGGQVVEDLQEPEGVRFNTVVRNGVTVGACPCDVEVAEGEEPVWGNGCSLVCPTNREDSAMRPGNLAWDPISAPECGTIYSQHPAQSEIADVRDASLCRYLEMEFSHDDATNLKNFTWNWQVFKDFDHDGYRPINLAVDAPVDPSFRRITKVRVSWPDYAGGDEDIRYPPENDQEVTFSEMQPMEETGGFHLDADYFGPKFIQRMVVEAVADDRWFDPRGPLLPRAGYILAYNPDTVAHFAYDLAGEQLKGEFPRKLVYPSDMQARLQQNSIVSATAGIVERERLGMEPGVQKTLLIYETVEEREFLFSRLWIGLIDENQISMMNAQEVLSTETTPAVQSAQLIFMPDEQKLYLFGKQTFSPPQSTVHILDLTTGRWKGPRVLNLPQGFDGYSVDVDPSRRQAILCGALERATVTHPDPVNAPVVYTVELSSLQVREIPPAAGAGSQVARRNHGAFFDARDRFLYISGGKRQDTLLNDTWRFDMLERTWSQIAPLGPEGPNPAAQPFVWYDRDQGRLWVGDLEGQDTEVGVQIHALDTHADEVAWMGLEVVSDVDIAQDEFHGTLLGGSTAAYPLFVPEDVDLPGRLMLAELQASGPGMRMKAVDLEGIWNAAGVGEAGARYLSFFGAPGGRYMLQLHQGIGAVDYTLRADEAVLAEKGQSSNLGRIVDMHLDPESETVFAASPKGLFGISYADPAVPQKLFRYLGGLAATGLEPCGNYVCLSKLGFLGLEVIDVSDSQDVHTVGSAVALGPSFDIVVRGTKAYLAQGPLGVLRYDLSDPTRPEISGFIWTWGKAVTLATTRGMLAVGHKHGAIKLFCVDGDDFQLVGNVQIDGKPRKMVFVGDYLHVQKKSGSTVIIDVSLPKNPSFRGEYSGFENSLVRLRLAGRTAVSYGKKRIQVYGVEAVQ